MSCTWVQPYLHHIIISFLVINHVNVDSENVSNAKCTATIELRCTVLYIPETILSAEKYFKQKEEDRMDMEYFNVNLHYAQ